MIYYDTETCGFHGPIVLIQYAEDAGPIELYHVWDNKIKDTIDLIEHLCSKPMVGFNVAFDHFHLCQMYTTLFLMKDKDAYLENCIEEYADNEPQGRFGPCLKPVSVFDVMLHARKTAYQSTMDREDIRIKRVPSVLAQALVNELDKRVQLSDVYFARKQNKTARWQVVDIKNEFDDVDPDFKDVMLRFAPSSGLKALATDALGYETHGFDDTVITKPAENGFAPFAHSISKRITYPHDKCHGTGCPDCEGKGYIDYGIHWNNSWPVHIKQHMDHWLYSEKAVEYATNDIVYTRELYRYFCALASGLQSTDARTFAKDSIWTWNTEPVAQLMDDTDSKLAAMVGAVRWRGYNVDLGKMKALKTESEKVAQSLPVNHNSSDAVRKYISEVMTPVEALILKDTTKKTVLEEVAKWRISEVCDCGGLDDKCIKCKDGLIETNTLHPAAVRAQEILFARTASKEIEVYDKILTAGRFHASFKVIGALSGRMSGTDDLNPQGIRRDKRVRECFTLADDDEELDGGDFAGFEVVLIDSVYQDPVLHEELCSGKKIHGLFGQYLFPHLSYDAIIKSKGAHNPWEDYYTRSKNGVFALAYGGEAFTLSNRVGVPEEDANAAYQKFIQKYVVFGNERKRYFDMFCSMRQPKGLGTRVEWHEPSDYIESMFGFRRYFTLENSICKALFNLAESPPKEWESIKVKVTRRDRLQTAVGAVRSALFGAAFAVQAGNMRAAGNHKIQSSGAQLCKELEAEIWDLQPVGVHNWIVRPMNIHDELMIAAQRGMSKAIRTVVDNFINKNKPVVPLLEIEWGNELKSWAEK